MIFDLNYYNCYLKLFKIIKKKKIEKYLKKVIFFLNFLISLNYKYKLYKNKV